MRLSRHLIRRPWQLARFDRFLVYGAIAASGSGLLAGSLHVFSAALRDYQIGDSFADLPALTPSVQAATVVMFVSANCGASMRSAEALRHVSRTPRTYRVAVIGYESDDLLQRFVGDASIQADIVATAPVGAVRLTRVPQVVVLNARGLVARVWSGSQDIAVSRDEILVAARSLATQSEGWPRTRSWMAADRQGGPTWQQ